MSWLFQPILSAAPIAAYNKDLAGVVDVISSVPNVSYFHRVRKALGTSSVVSSVPNVPYIRRRRKFIGIVIGAASGATGVLRRIVPPKLLVGVLAAVSTAQGIAKRIHRILGITQVASSTLGILKRRRRVIGPSAVASSIGGTMKTRKEFVGVSGGSAQVSSIAKRTRRFVDWVE
jgi:hypothetical protein